MLCCFCSDQSDGTSCGGCKVPLSPLITILINGSAFRVIVSGQQIRFLYFEVSDKAFSLFTKQLFTMLLALFFYYES